MVVHLIKGKILGVELVLVSSLNILRNFQKSFVCELPRLTHLVIKRTSRKIFFAFFIMYLALGIYFLTFLTAQIISAKEENLLSLFSESNAKFASNFYSAVINDRSDENVVISPFSVQICGALVYSGTAGSSADEMAQGLSLTRNDRFAVGNVFQAALEKHKSQFLQIANKIYLGKNAEIKEEFEKIVKNNFFSEEQKVDFAKSEETANIINNWVKNSTHNKINKLFEKNDFDASVFMVLVNTIHFKDEWTLPFEKTFMKPFWTSENVSKDVEMMFVSDEEFKFARLDELNATAVQLDYENSDAAMLIILPNERTGLKQLEEELSKIVLIDLQKRLQKNYVHVYLPKFNIEFSVDLPEPFSKMGMNSIFNEANLNNMIHQNGSKVAVDKAIHKAFIQVTETGTEAGAAAGFSVYIKSLPFQFTADHPFFFAILSKSAVLFMGRYVN